MRFSGIGQWNRIWAGLVGIGVLIGSLSEIGVVPAQAYERLGPNTRSDFRLWTPVYLTVSLPSRFLAYMEVNPRIGDDVTNIDQLLLRPAIGYKLTENISIWQGYAWVGNFNQAHTPPQSPFFDENRIYQQVNYKHAFGSVKFLSRTRLEERWIEHADGTAVRFRQMFRVAVPIQVAPEWAFVAYDEIFMNLNTVGSSKGKGPSAGVDQNRFFLGINRTFSQYFNMDIGYQNQMLNSRQLPGNANLINHIFMLQFYINL